MASRVPVRRVSGPGKAGRRRILALVTGACATAALAVAVPGVASAAPAALPANCTVGLNLVTCTYGYTGAEQTFTVPAGTTSVSVSANGAACGYSVGLAATGGRGAEVTGALGGLAAGQNLYVEVGGTPTITTTPNCLPRCPLRRRI